MTRYTKTKNHTSYRSEGTTSRNTDRWCICVFADILDVLTWLSAESVGVVEALLPYSYGRTRKIVIYSLKPQKDPEATCDALQSFQNTDLMTFLLIYCIITYVSQAGEVAHPPQAESFLIGRLASPPHLRWVLWLS